MVRLYFIPELCGPLASRAELAVATRSARSRQDHVRTKRLKRLKKSSRRAPDPPLGAKDGRWDGRVPTQKGHTPPLRAAGRSVGADRVGNAKSRKRGSVAGRSGMQSPLITSHLPLLPTLPAKVASISVSTTVVSAPDDVLPEVPEPPVEAGGGDGGAQGTSCVPAARAVRAANTASRSIFHPTL